MAGIAGAVGAATDIATTFDVCERTIAPANAAGLSISIAVSTPEDGHILLVEPSTHEIRIAGAKETGHFFDNYAQGGKR